MTNTLLRRLDSLLDSKFIRNKEPLGVAACNIRDVEVLTVWCNLCSDFFQKGYLCQSCYQTFCSMQHLDCHYADNYVAHDPSPTDRDPTQIPGWCYCCASPFALGYKCDGCVETFCSTAHLKTYYTQHPHAAIGDHAH